MSTNNYEVDGKFINIAIWFFLLTMFCIFMCIAIITNNGILAGCIAVSMLTCVIAQIIYSLNYSNF